MDKALVIALGYSSPGSSEEGRNMEGLHRLS